MEPLERSWLKKKKKSSSGAAIQSLNSDTLCIIFSRLRHFDLARCSTVCKSWYNAIYASDLLKEQFCKQQQDGGTSLFKASSSSRVTLKDYLQEWAMKQHNLSLQSCSVDIDQWNCHASRVSQCRMKMGSILTGVGDKVIRIWSAESYKCLEEYAIPDSIPLADFDFDENKIVGLVGTRICIWRRHGKRSIFPSHEGTFPRGLCMRYVDPEAVVGCEDGTARVFDMYSKKCSHIIRMRDGPVTCLAVTDDQLILCGSSLGSVQVTSLSSDQNVASLKSPSFTAGIRSLCFNPNSSLVFAGSTAGSVSCWDLRAMKQLWDTRISPNIIYSMQHMHNDTSSLVVGGIDGILRVLDQNTGDLLSCYFACASTTRASSSSTRCHVAERKKAARLTEDVPIDSILKTMRPAITCLAVGMKKVVTAHNSKSIRMWKFNQ